MATDLAKNMVGAIEMVSGSWQSLGGAWSGMSVGPAAADAPEEPTEHELMEWLCLSLEIAVCYNTDIDHLLVEALAKASVA